MNDRLTILQGDCIERLRELPDESVHCCVTSPPYWGLRDYGCAGQIGLEQSLDGYLESMVRVFSEVRRVLRGDGTLWLNLGDSYASTGGHSDTNCNERRGQRNIATRPEHENRQFRVGAGGTLKAKDLCMVPARTALALQADGWYLRADIIWHKPNPMPESVTDRPTKSHEYIFLLSKSEQYYYDHIAASEPAAYGDKGNSLGSDRKKSLHPNTGTKRRTTVPRGGFNGKTNALEGREAFRSIKDYRNKRSVWTVTTAPFKGAHFATFPPDLIKPCILAGTSAFGCCAECGAPWERLTEMGAPDIEHQRACGGDANGEYNGHAKKDYAAGKAQNASETKARILRGMAERKTVGWKPTCDCGSQKTVPCSVLDPFAGSGTTGAVAIELGRRGVLIELNPAYVELIKQRCQVTPGLALA